MVGEKEGSVERLYDLMCCEAGQVGCGFECDRFEPPTVHERPVGKADMVHEVAGSVLFSQGRWMRGE